MSARDMLSHTTRLAAELEQAMLLEVKVGLPAETVGTKIYTGKDGKPGPSIVELGAAHEYGARIKHPGGTSYGYKTEKDAEKGKVSFLSSGAGFMQLGTTKAHIINLPRRSFLRVPFMKNRKDLMRQQSELFAKVVDGKTTASLALQRLGVIAENYSRRAFRTMGYGTWKPSQKATGQTMVDTGTLRSSITSVVVKRAS